MSPPRGKRPNITRIAAKCGVSKMTVSRVLRNKANVAPATRRRVLDVAERSGFVPSGRYAARVSEPVKNYYVLFQRAHSLTDAYFSGVIRSIQHHLFLEGLSCSLGVIGDDYPEFLRLVNMLSGQEIAGLFIVGEVPAAYVSGLLGTFPRLVLIDYPGGPEIDRPYNAVCVDNVFGGHLAMRHLLKLGRSKILLIGGREGHYFSEDMLRAYREALTRSGLPVVDERIARGDFHVASGLEAARDAFARGVEFDGVFSNDEMACGALKALTEAGIRVPEDVSVVGFDGLPMGEAVSPSLTTVAVDRTELGRLAVERLVAMAGESAHEQRHNRIAIFPKLVIRASCGAGSAGRDGTE